MQSLGFPFPFQCSVSAAFAHLVDLSIAYMRVSGPTQAPPIKLQHDISHKSLPVVSPFLEGSDAPSKNSTHHKQLQNCAVILPPRSKHIEQLTLLSYEFWLRSASSWEQFI